MNSQSRPNRSAERCGPAPARRAARWRRGRRRRSGFRARARSGGSAPRARRSGRGRSPRAPPGSARRPRRPSRSRPARSAPARARRRAARARRPPDAAARSRRRSPGSRSRPPWPTSANVALHLDVELGREQRVVAELRVRVEREVVGERARGRRRRALPGGRAGAGRSDGLVAPEHAVVDDHELRAGSGGALEELARARDAAGDLRHLVGADDLQAGRPYSGKRSTSSSSFA